jgi:Family of unknown function (DUF6093)
MSAVSALLRGRTAAAALFLDTITVTRLTGVTNVPDAGTVTNVYTTIYSGPGKIQRTPRTSRVQPANVGEAEVFMSRLELHLPIAAVGITADDIATVTASQLDPDLVGKVFHVREIAAKTLQTARRFGIEFVAS